MEHVFELKNVYYLIGCHVFVYRLNCVIVLRNVQVFYVDVFYECQTGIVIIFAV